MSFNIELKNIHFSYEPLKPIINNISFAVKKGEVIGIKAPVGKGKSTFLKICAGLIEPHKGELIIDNKNFWNLSTIEQNSIRKDIGFDFQEAALISNMTISGNLALPLQYHNILSQKDINNQINIWLTKLDLLSYKDQLPAALSMGLKRRVGFIRSVILPRKLFCWDDPMQGRTREFKNTIIETILDKQKQGISSIITTQDEDFLRKTANKILAFDNGKILVE